MEKSKQALPTATSLYLPYLQQNLNKTNLTKYLFSAVFQAGLLCAVVFTAAVSSAAPPEHVHQDFASTTHGNASPKGGNTEEFARGRILVMPRAGFPAKAFAEILKEHDGKPKKIGQSDLYIVELPEYSEEGVVTKLQHHPHLKLVEFDRIALPAMIPNDYYYPREWHFSKIGAQATWDITQGEGITIAILDTGVDLTHPDLAGNLVPGWNFYDNNSNTADVIGHGSFVAGTAAALTDNSIGVSSIASKSKVMPLRVTDINGYGSISKITSALIYAADNGARVANMSFLNLTSQETIRTAAQYMKDKNGLVVTSGGNTGALENYTVSTTMISVSATDELDQKADFSSYGDYIALAAPGTKIWSTGKDGTYGVAGGTSIASPVVGSVIALMMSANPKLSSTEIENLLFSTAVDLGDPGRDIYFGYGRVDAAAAVQAAKTAIPSLDIEAPHVTIINPLEGATLSGLIPVDIDATDNIGVTRAELWINNTNVATDTSQPFSFSWDSTGVVSGATSLEVRVFDAAGNIATSSIAVNVNNPTTSTPNVDTQAPVVQIVNPVAGNVSGSVTITVNASDNNGAAGITQFIYIDGMQVATGTGSTLSYSWNTRSKKVKAGLHTIQAIAKDVAGNLSSTSVTINVIK